MDEELNRRMVALEAAEREWREHRLTGYELGFEGGGPTIGTATGQPFTREWREREEELWATFQAARETWRSYRPDA
jgi:hypothetical protein